MSYQLFHLRDSTSSHAQRLVEVLKQRAGQLNHWGIFPGVFGLGTNEAYWLVEGASVVCPIHADDQVELLVQVTLGPTVRPKEYAPRTKPGIYVFRWFEVEADKVDEVVALSDKAWSSFEGGFDTEIQGLFTVQPKFDRYAMVLVTWYKNLAVWQDSREPDPEARQLFVQRQALLDSARPIATRLELVE